MKVNSIKKEGNHFVVLLNNNLFYVKIPENVLNKRFLVDNILNNRFEAKSLLTNRQVIFIKDNLPLLGTQYFGYRDWPSNVLELRPITGCLNKCPFCSVREGPNEGYWKTDYYVDREYLVEWGKYLIKEKRIKHPNFYINPQGEPVLYDELPELIRDLSEHGMVGITSTLAEIDISYIEDLIESGLTYINVSLHSLHPIRAKALVGNPNYDVIKVKEIIEQVSGRVEITITPVIYKYNIMDLEELVKFAQTLKNKWRAKIVPQIYMEYKHGRKLPISMRLSFKEFSNYLKTLESKYNIKLLNIDLKSVGIYPGKLLSSPISVGERFKVKFTLPGRRPNEYLTEYKNRVVSIYSTYEDFKVARIISTKGNIYIAKAVY